MSSHLESRDRPSPPHRRWNSIAGWCLSRKCSSSKLQLVPGRRESDMEVDQGWHLWDLIKYKWDTALSFRLRVSKQQIPLDSGMHFQPTSCQYPSRKHTSTTSYHTEWVQVKNQFTHSPTSLTLNKIWNLEMRRMSMSKLQSLSSWRQRHHEQPLGIPGLKRPSLPHRWWNCWTNWCLSRKRSSSKLQLVPGQRESDSEVDQGWHLWDLIKYKWDTTFSFPLSDSEFPNNNSHWIQGKCLWHKDALPANIMRISQ